LTNKALTKAELKSEVRRQIEEQRCNLIGLSLNIHDNPELGYKETKASGLLTGYLAENGFDIEKGVGGFATAFRATYGDSEPLIALLAEYDALPEIGHGCGHNIIAASSVGAAVASKLIVDNFGGSVVVFGTPAEELFGGKVPMLHAGVFKGVDVAMIVHPGLLDAATNQALACIGIDVEFFGKAAHAAAYPELGINALEAMILSFNAINSLRQHISDTARIHGVITHGGDAANVVPSHSAASFLVRAQSIAYLDDLKKKVLNCFEGAALATGARLNYKWADVVYEPMKNNLVLAELFTRNMESLGRKMAALEAYFGFGSTDMGNVSQVIPAIHPSVAVSPPDVLLHSAEFAAAAASESGHRGMLDAAKALAMTIVDLLGDPGTMKRVKDELSGRVQQ
jgi:amidohydrolase